MDNINENSPALPDGGFGADSYPVSPDRTAESPDATELFKQAYEDASHYLPTGKLPAEMPDVKLVPEFMGKDAAKMGDIRVEATFGGNSLEQAESTPQSAEYPGGFDNQPVVVEPTAVDPVYRGAEDTDGPPTVEYPIPPTVPGTPDGEQPTERRWNTAVDPLRDYRP